MAQTEHSDDLKHVLDVARSALDREFQRAERLDAKARGQATLAGSWFAVTQAVTAVSLRVVTPKGWLIAIVALLLLQATALIVLFAASARVWRLRERNDVGPETIKSMSADVGDPSFADNAVGLYRYILYHAQEANEQRAAAFRETWWWLVVVLGIAEMAATIIARSACG